MKRPSIAERFFLGNQKIQAGGMSRISLSCFASCAFSAVLLAMLIYSVLFPPFRSTATGTAGSPNVGQTAEPNGRFHSQGDGAIRARISDLSITLIGAELVQEECGSPFNDPGATAVNGAGQAVAVVVSGTVDTANPGSYQVTYTAVEGQKSVSVVRTVTVVDTVPPSIILDGANPMTLTCGRPFVDPGASAIDNCQGSLPVTISGTVDENIPGTYVLTYTAKDKYDNVRTVTRTVIVGSTEANPPTITLNGEPEMTVECGGVFSDPGASAADPCYGPVPIESSGNVNVDSPGSYMITYSATSLELKADASRAVSIVDTKAPIISLAGENPLTIQVHQTFKDPGATAYDGCAANFAATASGIVDPNTIGSYTITYSATDPSGNEATPVKRTVNVVEIKQPTASTGVWTVIDHSIWLLGLILT